MNNDYTGEDFEADFALCGELEFDEAEEDGEALEVELLLGRAQAARDAGV